MTDRQTDTDRQKGRQALTQTDRQTDRDRQTGRHTNRQTDTQADRHKETHRDRQTNRQTDYHIIYMYFQINHYRANSQLLLWQINGAHRRAVQCEPGGRVHGRSTKSRHDEARRASA